MIHSNSMIAYRKGVKKGFSKRRSQVINAFLKNKRPLTLQEVTDILGLAINQVSGRITELKGSNDLVECGSITIKTESKKSTRSLLKLNPKNHYSMR